MMQVLLRRSEKSSITKGNEWLLEKGPTVCYFSIRKCGGARTLQSKSHVAVNQARKPSRVWPSRRVVPKPGPPAVAVATRSGLLHQSGRKSHTLGGRRSYHGTCEAKRMGRLASCIGGTTGIMDDLETRFMALRANFGGSGVDEDLLSGSNSDRNKESPVILLAIVIGMKNHRMILHPCNVWINS